MLLGSMICVTSLWWPCQIPALERTIISPSYSHSQLRVCVEGEMVLPEGWVPVFLPHLVRVESERSLVWSTGSWRRRDCRWPGWVATSTAILVAPSECLRSAPNSWAHPRHATQTTGSGPAINSSRTWNCERFAECLFSKVGLDCIHNILVQILRTEIVTTS